MSDTSTPGSSLPLPTLRLFKVFTPTVHGGVATISASQVSISPSGVLMFFLLTPVNAEEMAQYLIHAFNSQQWLAFEEVTAVVGKQPGIAQ